MADFREAFDVGPEERFRMMFTNLQRHLHTSMIGIVSEASDGHTLSIVPAVKLAVVDPKRTETTYEDIAQLIGVPISFVGGGGTVLTHPAKPGDEYVLDFMSRPFGNWQQNGGQSQPETDRMHSLSDAVARPSVRSDPRRLQQVSGDAMHARDESKHAVHEVKPGVGVRSFHADPSTPAASETYDPLVQAVKYVGHLAQSGVGAVGQAVDGDTRHDHGSFHGTGSWLQSFSGRHKVLAGLAGALLSAFDGKHKVNADASGVQIASEAAVAISAPPGMLSLAGLASGGIPGDAVQTGGDLQGTADQAKVTNLSHVVGQHTALVQAASDAAAAAAGVGLGSVYVNTAVKTGVGVLAVRLA